MKILRVLFPFLLCLPLLCLAKSMLSINPGAYIWHTDGQGKGYTQYTNNQFFAIEGNSNPASSYRFSAGTLLNSFSDRCILLGLRKDWWGRDGWKFKGGYAYVGEFFIPQFSHCGDDGVYHNVRNITGIGFVPYIYHAVQFDFNEKVGIEGGLIFPSVLVISFQIHF